MSEVPETRYAKSGGCDIAYQVVGEGVLDLVFVPGFASQVEHWWDEREPAAFLQGLASFARLILFDKRGTGLSDRLADDDVPTLEERMDDLRAVMDAVGSQRAALLGVSEGGPLCLLFAATYPDRVHSVVLMGSYARMRRDEPDYPWGATGEMTESFEQFLMEKWGTGEYYFEIEAPSARGDERVRQWGARQERLGATPRAAAKLSRLAAAIDVRHVCATVKVPTLVLHRTGDRLVPVEMGRYVADHIAGARFIEYAGDDHVFWWSDPEAVVGDIEEFLTGSRQERAPDRVLATVLFTDIVGSTEQASRVGDAAWRVLLDRHDDVARSEIDRHRGHLVKSTGDGLLVTFDGPARAIRCAAAIRDALRPHGLSIRTGLHTGEIELRGADVGGIGVHIAARVEEVAQPDEILVSRTVTDLVAGSGIEFAARGTYALKGIAGDWQLFAVTRV